MKCLANDVASARCYLANDIKLLQDVLERGDFGGELRAEEDPVSVRSGLCVRLSFDERTHPILASETPASGSERVSVAALVSVDHDRSAVSQVELDHVSSTVAENLGADGLLQMVRTQEVDQLLEEARIDFGKVADFALGVLVRHESVLISDLEDMAMDGRKINCRINSYWLSPAAIGLFEVTAEQDASSGNLSITVNKMNT